ncbi:rhombotarget A [Acinetobacter sp. TGL-Y2]|uniref:rhombotarget A n=1 Tax=Acinetobacter sp. TGL-Y2 TaxID=1407071 RepID=UPI0007A67F5B|nr:rhombotarget A [Acinetobacter sp. TGL-Y2]AMW78318.1 rhombotarget A [Acinetobacter sp. TGL-Y2]
MLKHGIGLFIFCVSSQVFSADIVVTTTDDIVKADNACSLREAIEYVNKGMPEVGYNGCGGKDASENIILSNAEYKLNSQINISRTLNLRARYDSSPTENMLGRKNAVIKMAGQDRIFNIDRSLVAHPPEEKDNLIQVSLFEITLNGCDAAVCKDQGGLIYNKEILSIELGQLLNGKAREGGAIYNAGRYEKDKILSSVSIQKSLLQGNKAQQGGVVYSEIPQYTIAQSVIRDNEASSSNAALFYARDGFDEETSKSLGTFFGRGISNSTIFNNSGYIVRVMDGMTINNITMILNKMGLILDAPFKQGIIANSILAKNGLEDCKVINGGSAEKISNNLYSAGCEGSQSQVLGNTNLIASIAVEGECDIASDGILCPFKQAEGVLLGYFRPRLLATDRTIADSPIVNKGPILNSGLLSCSGVDQRGTVRSANPELCDRGAIELKVDRQSTNNIGADIFYGQTGKMSIADQLADGELISPSQCQVLFGNAPNNQTWQAGCMKIVQTNTPSKGNTQINQEGEVTYVPNGNWHGSDEFKILVVTTTTRFNDSSNPYIEIPTKVVQSPENNFQDYKVKTSGGSYGFGGLMILLGLIVLRRLKKQ